MIRKEKRKSGNDPAGSEIEDNELLFLNKSDTISTKGIPYTAVIFHFSVLIFYFFSSKYLDLSMMKVGLKSMV